MKTEKDSGLANRKNICVCKIVFGCGKRGRKISRRGPPETARGTQQVANWELTNGNS